jgi:hypothetical protein
MDASSRINPQLQPVALSAGPAARQAAHKLETLSVRAGQFFRPTHRGGDLSGFDRNDFLATRIRRLPLPAGLVLALGA